MSISMKIKDFPVECTYLALHDPTVTKGGFWCSESGNNVNVTRQWVQEWELFRIVDDPFSGATMLMSNQTRKYVSVTDSGEVRCVESQSTRETHLTLSEDTPGQVTVKAANGNYIKTDQGNLNLRADGKIPYEFDLFKVAVVSICKHDDVDGYATPRQKDRKYIAMESSNPINYYLLFLGDDTSKCYIETQNFEFLNPSNTTLPVTYDLSPYDAKNFRMYLKPVDGDPTAFRIQGEAANNNYLNWQESSQWPQAVFCDMKEIGGTTQQFRFIAAR